MRLSEAIMLGSIKKPQCFGSWFEGNPQEGTVTKTCALGAAGDALGFFDVPRTKEEVWDLAKIWPILEKSVESPVSGLVYRLGHIIMWLNDKERWTRPQIAAWVAEQEVKLGVVSDEVVQVEVKESEHALL